MRLSAPDAAGRHRRARRGRAAHPAAPVSAQGIGVGARFRGSSPTSTRSLTWTLMRCASSAVSCGSSPGAFGLEVSVDHHSESFEFLNQKVTETPIQTSVIFRRGGGRVSPFLLVGPGWYRRKVEALTGLGNVNVSTTEFGWHAGVGLEILPRNISESMATTATPSSTSPTEDGEGFIGRLLPGTAGRCGRWARRCTSNRSARIAIGPSIATSFCIRSVAVMFRSTTGVALTLFRQLEQDCRCRALTADGTSTALPILKLSRACSAVVVANSSIMRATMPVHPV